MNTVTFGIYNSFEDLGLILSAKRIGAPAPKLLSVDIPCGDGELDYTEYFGRVNYSNRELSFDFTVAGDTRDYLNVYSRLQNLLNGQKMKITLSDDPSFYYVGRVIVDEWASQKNIGKVTVKVNAEPYKMKHAPTVIYRTIDKDTYFTCHNLRKPVVATLTVEPSDGVGFVGFKRRDDYWYNELDPIRNGVYAAIFEEGENRIVVEATKAVKVRIEYQEGGL